MGSVLADQEAAAAFARDGVVCLRSVLDVEQVAVAAEAIGASLRVSVANLPAMLLWAALIVALTALGFLTLLLGMVVVAPLLGYATWHAYRDLVV